MVLRRFDGERDVVALPAPQRAAVRADHGARLCERVEVAADGDGRNGETVGQLLDGDALFRLDLLDDLSAALLDEELLRRRGGRRRPAPAGAAGAAQCRPLGVRTVTCILRLIARYYTCLPYII